MLRVARRSRPAPKAPPRPAPPRRLPPRTGGVGAVGNGTKPRARAGYKSRGSKQSQKGFAVGHTKGRPGALSCGAAPGQARGAVPHRQVQHLHASRHDAARELQDDAERGTAAPVWPARSPRALLPRAQRGGAARFGLGCLPEKRLTEGFRRWALRQSGPHTLRTGPGQRHPELAALWGILSLFCFVLFWGGLFACFVFLDGVSLCRPGWRAELRSRISASLNSWTQAILLPQPPKVLGLQVETLSAKLTAGCCGCWDEKDLVLSLQDVTLN
uniref:uncharacterized protein LOC128928286 n=1 Tax=Callithrix jacchus TaxID=9483 RepID=UPI0023DCEC6C|nr:uncharacterized protein LOC128928286 [Callithrix jacchus]